MATSPRRSVGSKARKPKAAPHGLSEGQDKPASSKRAKPATQPAKTQRKTTAAATGNNKPSRGAAVSPLHAEIKRAAANGFRFYVYTLSDPSGVFYVGKGQRNRLLMHGTTCDKSNAAKALRLATHGASVRRTIVAHFKAERDALSYERALIAESRDSLTNIASGGLPQDPKERASAIAAAMLARLKPREQVRPEWRAAFDMIRAEIEKEVAEPTPTSITINHAGKVIARGYCEVHPLSFRAYRGVSAL